MPHRVPKPPGPDVVLLIVWVAVGIAVVMLMLWARRWKPPGGGPRP
jgi:hypothetical protein